MAQGECNLHVQVRGVRMKLLSDLQIRDRVKDSVPPLVVGISAADWQSKDSAIQPCSVDLHIGCIQIPARDDGGRVQAISKVGDRHLLDTGATAVLTTSETLNMPAKIAGIGFPPSHISIQGLLMTNPGHVDPGYRGRMHFTVINMGRRPIPLEIGSAICTLLFFELDSDVGADWGQRSMKAAEDSLPLTGLSDRAVNQLARDFVDVDKRAEKKVREAQVWASVLAGVIALLISLASQMIPYYVTGAEEAKRNDAVMAAKIESLEKRMDQLQGQEPVKPQPQVLRHQVAPVQ